MSIFRKALLLATVATFVMAGSANATQFSFYNITNNGYSDLAGQLSVDVIANTDGTVSFKFFNNVGIASSITAIYFDDGPLFGISSISDSGDGVDYLADPSGSGTLPGWKNATPPFLTTRGFWADPSPPTQPNGVNASDEWVMITFALTTGQTYGDVIAALDRGCPAGVDDPECADGLRIGLHVQAIGATGGSDSYINNGRVVPDGGMTLMLLGGALVGLGALRRKFRA